MKTKSIFLALLAMTAGLNVFAQEADDMYFTSKDRAKLNQNVREAVVLASAKEKGTNLQTINPSDSYSARNENPDYIAGSKVGTNAPQQNSSYFTSTYVPNVNQNLYNCNCNTGYNNYNNYAYGNPYYNSYGYNNYGMYGYGSPYSSMYGMGGMGYGMYGMGYSMMGMGFGYGSMYGMYGYPYMGYGYGMGSYYGYGYPSYGYGYGMGSYYYPQSSYAVNNYNPDNTTTVYGRRPQRSGLTSNVNNYYANRGAVASTGGNSNWRNSTAATSSSYYSKGWRDASTSQGHSNWGSAWHNTGSNSGRTSNTGWNNGWSNGNSNSGWSNSRSSGFSNGGFGGGHSGGGFSGGGGGHSGGGGRGRH